MTGEAAEQHMRERLGRQKIMNHRLAFIVKEGSLNKLVDGFTRCPLEATGILDVEHCGRKCIYEKLQQYLRQDRNPEMLPSFQEGKMEDIRTKF